SRREAFMKHVILMLSLAVTIHAAVSVRILLGLGNETEAPWDGSIQVRGGRILEIEPWRFEGDDAVLSNNAWKMRTHRIRLFGGAAAPAVRPVVANGLVVHLEGESEASELQVHTPQ